MVIHLALYSESHFDEMLKYIHTNDTTINVTALVIQFKEQLIQKLEKAFETMWSEQEVDESLSMLHDITEYSRKKNADQKQWYIKCLKYK